MVDFKAHFTIHTIKIGFQKVLHFSIVLESRSSSNSLPNEHSLRYFHLDRISLLLAAEKRFRVV